MAFTLIKKPTRHSLCSELLQIAFKHSKENFRVLFITKDLSKVSLHSITDTPDTFLNLITILFCNDCEEFSKLMANICTTEKKENINRQKTVFIVENISSFLSISKKDFFLFSILSKGVYSLITEFGYLCYVGVSGSSDIFYERTSLFSLLNFYLLPLTDLPEKEKILF